MIDRSLQGCVATQAPKNCAVKSSACLFWILVFSKGAAFSLPSLNLGGCHSKAEKPCASPGTPVDLGSLEPSSAWPWHS